MNTTTHKTPPLLTVRELAQRLSISVAGVYRLPAAGALSLGGVRRELGFDPREVERHLERHRVTGDAEAYRHE
jgi:hypothetical protein